MHGNPFFKSDPNLKEPDITYAGRFQRTRYVECTGGHRLAAQRQLLSSAAGNPSRRSSFGRSRSKGR